MAAKKKKRGEAGYDPQLRAKALQLLAELGGGRGTQAQVAAQLGVPASAVTYWAFAERARQKKSGNGHAAAPPPQPEPTAEPKATPSLAEVERQLEQALASVRAMQETYRRVFG